MVNSYQQTVSKESSGWWRCGLGALHQQGIATNEQCQASTMPGATRVARWAAALALTLLVTLVPGAPAHAHHAGDDQTTLSSSIRCNWAGKLTDNVTVYPPIDFTGRFSDGYRDLARVEYFILDETTGTLVFRRWSEWFYNNDAASAGIGVVGGRHPMAQWFDFSTHQERPAWTTTYPLDRIAAARVWIWDGRLQHFVTTVATATAHGGGFVCAPRAQYCYYAGAAGVTCTL